MRPLLFALLLAASALFPSAHAHALSDNEREYHSFVFDYAMGNLPAGKHYDWKTFESSGRIVVGDAFTSKSKSLCRPFSEEYHFSGMSGVMTGYGCKREGREGWCMLSNDNMLSCALEPSDGGIGDVLNAAAGAVPSGGVTINKNASVGEILGGAAVGAAKAVAGSKEKISEIGTSGTQAGQSAQRSVKNATQSQNKDGDDDKPWYDGYWPPWR